MSPNLLLTWTAFAALFGYALSQDFDSEWKTLKILAENALSPCYENNKTINRVLRSNKNFNLKFFGNYEIATFN